MRYLKSVFVILTLFTFGQLNGEVIEPFYSIHKVTSQNKRFFLKAIPYDNIIETVIGKTTVYKADSTVLYEIPRYFDISDNSKELFISNDGRFIAYIIDKEYIWKKIRYNSIELYRDGVLFKTFSIKDLINCDPDYDNCTLFYKNAIKEIEWVNKTNVFLYKENATDFQIKITKKACYISNDVIYIYTNADELLKINIKSGKLTHNLFNSLSKSKFSRLSVMNVESQKFRLNNESSRTPVLSKRMNLNVGLARYLGMEVFLNNIKGAEDLKCYRPVLELLIDTLGKAKLVSLKNTKGLPEEKIKLFIDSAIFEQGTVPKGLDKWIFTIVCSLMNKDKELSKRERVQELIEEKIEYEKRLLADTIEGHYIPKNLEDCFFELNKILKPIDIKVIKNEKYDYFDIHFGIGLWIRNNWGLWGGSRLQQYFKSKGEFLADDMSDTIIQYYVDWLNGKHDEWKEYENRKPK